METREVKTFIKKLSQLERSKSTSDKFRDFCEMAYCAYAKLTAPTEEQVDALEARYMEVVETYKDKDTVRAYPELLAMVWQGVLSGQDFLGSVAGTLQVLDAKNGQFFTPQSVSQVMAKMLLHDASTMIEEKGYITVQEPAAGAGGMLLAVADVLQTQGHAIETTMLTQATEINRLSYHMCYIQLAIRCIPAVVIHGNSLSGEQFDRAWTPATMVFQEHHGHLFIASPEPDVPDVSDHEDETYTPPTQLRLF